MGGRMPKNNIQHIEWTTRDPGRLRSFFARIFDWEFREAMPGYTMIDGVGGIFAAPDPQMPIGVTPYVNVADLAEKEKRITEAGGRIHKSRQEVGGMGSFTIFSDPDGNMLAMWQAAARPRAAAASRGRKKSARKTAARKTASPRARSSASRKARGK
jgi:predicted enzyme related to lactoylglutathione lyase